MTPYKIVAAEVRGQGLRYEILLNGGAALRQQDPAQKAMMTKFNPYVVDGENLLEVAIAPPDGEDTPPLDASLAMVVLEGEHGKAPGPEGRLFEWAWSPSDAPVQGPGFTPVLQAKLPTTVSHGRWSWQDAAPYTDADRADVEALAGRLHRALAGRDAGAVLALGAARTAHKSRALDVPEDELTRLQADGLRDIFAAQDYRGTPFDPGALTLQPRAGGRLVEVTSRGGAAITVLAMGREVPFGLTASHLPDGWTIVR